MPPDDDNSALQRAIEALAHVGSAAAKRGFYEALLESSLVVPATEDLGYLDHYGPNVPDVELIPLAKIVGTSGEVLQPVFTSDESLQTWLPGGCPHLRLAAKTLLGIVLRSDDHGAVLDPAGPVAVTLERWEVRALAEGRLPARTSAEHLAVDPRVVLRQIAKEVSEARTTPSAQWMENIRALLAPYGEVRGAYLVELEMGGASPGTKCVVAFDPEAEEGAVQKVLYFLNTRVPRTIAPGVAIDFMTSTNDDILWTCQVVGLRLYERDS